MRSTILLLILPILALSSCAPHSLNSKTDRFVPSAGFGELTTAERELAKDMIAAVVKDQQRRAHSKKSQLEEWKYDREGFHERFFEMYKFRVTFSTPPQGSPRGHQGLVTFPELPLTSSRIPWVPFSITISPAGGDLYNLLLETGERYSYQVSSRVLRYESNGLEHEHARTSNELF